MFQASQMHIEHPKCNTINYTSTSITITLKKTRILKLYQLNPKTLNMLIQSHMYTKLIGHFRVQHRKLNYQFHIS